MSKELAVLSAATLPALAPSMDVFRDIAQSAAFLSRIQLFTKGRYVDTGAISPGHYGIPAGDDTIEDLGEEIDVIPLTWRAKAIDMSDRDAIIVSFDSNSDEYRRIKNAADNTQDSHCMYGPTFLVLERSTGRYYELFFGNPSMRRESSKLLGFCAISPEQAVEAAKATGKKVEARGPLPCTLKVKYVTKGAYGWHVPVCFQCSTPFPALPDITSVVDEINKFHETKAAEVEKVEETPTTKRRAR
jgi:hypothetical protein